ncbi:acetate kinase [Streptosporangium becharense]|uniref:Acetate kinase n=1 Tax=Streptosporangium becharense TaxID=1816182 RepID=A0A7W9IKP1_9ACTN|nr:acetate/propionate family kinase [Streptosporangium becharense]MBB2911098.1 acetate kinase [Streptosporangium becharense]MBB5821844.1 acetate kinase [Streptosporangium becharense]
MGITDPAVLTVNAGSSSLQLHLVRGDRVLRTEHSEHSPDPGTSAQVIADFLDAAPGCDPVAVGHRLVHGGEAVREPTVADDGVLAAVRRYADLAPLHVPPALALVEAARRRLPGVPHVLCPDTAFHAALPEEAATYPLPAEWRSRYGLRRYGFHGLSYAWTLRRAAELLRRPAATLQVVLAHLGGGSSVCAVREGRSVDTSMGFTPLEGVPMSKRSGSVDPGMLMWLLSGSRLSLDELREGLEHRSGLLGLSDGKSGDTRELVDSDDPAAALALSVFAHRVSREIAAAATSLDRLDALVFTGEIGWDQPEVRDAVCRRLALVGVRPPVRDAADAADGDADGPVSAPDAAVPVLVVRPREELQLARDTLGVLDRASEEHREGPGTRGDRPDAGTETDAGPEKGAGTETGVGPGNGTEAEKGGRP